MVGRQQKETYLSVQKKEEREREPGENKIQIKILDINYAKKWRGEK